MKSQKKWNRKKKKNENKKFSEPENFGTHSMSVSEYVSI